jgi:DNA-binding transcriptional LysR family regulator
MPGDARSRTRRQLESRVPEARSKRVRKKPQRPDSGPVSDLPATTYITPEVWERLVADDSSGADPAELADRAWKVRCQSLVAIASLVSVSDAIGILSRGMVRHELEDGTLAVIPYEGTKPSAAWGIIHLRDRTLSPAAKAFIETVREADAEVEVE